MLKRVLLALVAVILLFSGYVAMQPSAFRVERSTIVVAPPAAVFAEVNELRAWDAWSPWAKLDPNAKSTYDGPASGEGAKVHWAGNSEVGEGTMTIIESKPDDQVKIRIDFEKPWQGTNTAEFTFKPDGPRTVTTWAMFGEHGFIEKAICLVMNGDKMIGSQFEKGLTSLKALVEGKAGQAAAPGPT